jgi:hypothetical protein
VSLSEYGLQQNEAKKACGCGKISDIVLVISIYFKQIGFNFQAAKVLLFFETTILFYFFGTRMTQIERIYTD